MWNLKTFHRIFINSIVDAHELLLTYIILLHRLDSSVPRNRDIDCRPKEDLASDFVKLEEGGTVLGAGGCNVSPVVGAGTSARSPLENSIQSFGAVIVGGWEMACSASYEEFYVRNRSRIGINKWYQILALRNFDLEDMELESINSGHTAKLPILKLGEYKMWAIRIKQYFQIQDYALWEVSTPATAEEKIKKKNDVKARGLLLMTLPNEHQLTFSQYPDAKSMFAAIETRFGGNATTKKTQKTLLKQQYENFSARSAKSLDSIFNRLQKIVSRLAILGVIIAQEDLNLKFLSSLPSEWNTHVVVWMNKPEIETMSIEDLYNNSKLLNKR
ncbi:hypothetical protein Tco_0655463 [Tanacetum coccineum]|uniref:Uncharacterized protein n=1 Tax=Tanacetum coccineum TaxID=301880 RepID=A0ABQ4X636_9ASTR